MDEILEASSSSDSVFFLLVELKNLVGCGENVGFPRYQANRSHS